MANLAFIGLGIMGLPMAGHLLAGGHRLSVFTRTNAKAQPLLDRGATWADSPAAAAKDADVVFTCVSDTPDVEQVLLGERGVIEVARPGMVVIDHSTISPAATRDMAAKLAERGTTLLDAPVSGGDVGARNATLAIMVGGDPAAFEQVRPLLALMGKTITHCGAVGNGQLTKLVNQILVAGANLATCEALTFAQKAGLDLKTTIQAVAGGAAGSWQLQNLGPRMAGGDFAPGFMIKLQVKDLRIVAEAEAEMGLTLPGLQHVTTLFDRAMADGRGDQGTQALYAVVKQTAGV
jgi:3-hydroxyisobutyrate dehydrogenase